MKSDTDAKPSPDRPQAIANAAGVSNVERPYGIEKRVPWTTSRITGSPDAPSPYEVKRVVPKLQFYQPVDLCNAPGSDRLYVAEQSGKIYSFKNAPECDHPDLFIDLAKEEQGLDAVYGMTFHPHYEKNRHVFICYVLKSGLADGSRVSRFTVLPTDPPRVDPAGESIVITWLSGGHNGGCLKFGPEGDLYISTGDGTGPNPPDGLDTGQDLSDLLSSILRIDVDHPDLGKKYAVPADNPFLNVSGARPENWAYGLRNPWKMSFDKKTGDLWVADVGWELWEMVYKVERGGNYGWSVVEGRQPARPEAQHGPTPILPPFIDHPHSEAASITGGYVYYGQRLKDLAGAYLYGDWVTGKVWAMRHDGTRVTWQQELVDSSLQVVSFGEDNSGEPYILDYGGGLYQLAPNPALAKNSDFPRRLSETGLFSSVAHHLPTPGVIPYSINAEPWADHATAERFVALPGTAHVELTKEKWTFPKDAVLAKTLSLEMDHGHPASRRRLETQILHFDGTEWRAYTYQWNEAQTDAALVDGAGLDQSLAIVDGQAPGGRRTQTWHFPSRAECMRCHNPWTGVVLGFALPQLNKNHRYATVGSANEHSGGKGIVDHQLRALAHIDILSQDLEMRPAPKLADPYDTTAGVNERARAYLHVNCSHCHRENAGGSGPSQMLYDLPLKKTGMVGAAPTQGAFGIPGAHVVSPGEPFRSVLFYRLSTLGQGHMPRLGSSDVDVAGANLLHDWIQQLPKERAQEPAGESAAARLNAEIEAALKQVRSGVGLPPETRASAMDRLLESTLRALALVHEADRNSLPPAVLKEIADKAGVHPNVLVRDLFDRFLPEEKRLKKLGPAIKPEEILTLKGAAGNGKRIFQQEGGPQCSRCHRVQGEGREFGPDLSQIGRKYQRFQLLEHIVKPSLSIDPNYMTYMAETRDELVYSGFLLKKTADEVWLKDASDKEIRLPARELKLLQPQQVSTMPEGLLQGLTAQAVADLLEYLASLQ